MRYKGKRQFLEGYTKATTQKIVEVGESDSLTTLLQSSSSENVTPSPD